MDTATHAAIGITLSKFAKNPRQAFLVGLISHIVCDFMPHGDPHPLEPGSLPYWLYSIYLIDRFGDDDKKFWGGLGAAVPDLELVLEYFKITKRRYCHKPEGKGYHGGFKGLFGHVVNLGYNVFLFNLWKKGWFDKQ